MSRIRIVKGKITEISRSVKTIAVDGGITLSAAGQIKNSAVSGLSYGVYDFEAVTKNNPVPTVFWYDSQNNEVKAKKININGQEYDNVVYGEQVRFEIKDSRHATLPDQTNCGYEVRSVGVNPNFKSKTGSNFSLHPRCRVEGGIVKSELFTLPLYWYQEDYEAYDYTNKRTKVDKVLEIRVFDGLVSQGPLDKSTLKPYTYFRNYEEIVGLFHLDNSGKNTQTTNYENRFIDSHNELAEEVDAFLNFIITKDLTYAALKQGVEDTGHAIWDFSNTRVKSSPSHLDDRPLYWARNKISAYLKRHPLFKNDIDYTKSLVNAGSQLAAMIQLFEAASRNYQVDFSHAPDGMKKVLITGFDPFLLDSFKHPYKDHYNILQSNPSGVVALALNDNVIENTYIQTMMIPVRYTDFDGHQQHDGDLPGIGIIEKYIGPLINTVDMIITVSQSLPNSYNIDVFATATRGGMNDNADFLRDAGSKAVSTTAAETIETTLPDAMDNASLRQSLAAASTSMEREKILANLPSSVIRSMYYGEYYETKSNSDNEVNLRTATMSSIPTTKVYNGPGGNYLSNEIFYRVAKLRKDNRPLLPTGHFHIAKIQLSAMDKDLDNITMQSGDDLDNVKITTVIQEVTKTVASGFKTIK